MIQAHLRFANLSIWSLRQIDTGIAALKILNSASLLVDVDPTKNQCQAFVIDFCL